jgi:hypothetical protein
VRSLDKASNGCVTISDLMNSFKSEFHKLTGTKSEPAPVSRRNSLEDADGDQAMGTNSESDPKLLSHSPAKMTLEPVPSEVEVIDWDTYPLPEDGIWERRYDKKTGKVCGPPCSSSPLLIPTLSLVAVLFEPCVACNPMEASTHPTNIFLFLPKTIQNKWCNSPLE